MTEPSAFAKAAAMRRLVMDAEDLVEGSVCETCGHSGGEHNAERGVCVACSFRCPMPETYDDADIGGLGSGPRYPDLPSSFVPHQCGTGCSPPDSHVPTEVDRCKHGRYRIDPCFGCDRAYLDGLLVGRFDTDESCGCAWDYVPHRHPEPQKRAHLG